MLYQSTRGLPRKVSAAEAIKLGIAADGGLYVPDSIPFFNETQIARLVKMDYQERAVQVLGAFLTDYTAAELKECLSLAYSRERFDHPAITPVVAVTKDSYVLELWHGPTSAFKDMALQVLPHLLSHALRKTGERAEIAILVATSGDTGKAALEGFRDVSQTKIIVFYPEEGVSDIQKRQMVTQEGRNVAVVAVRGNFDDAQTGVKQLFGNASFVSELRQRNIELSSANSINWGRLVPQIVYYFSAYAELIKAGDIKPGEPINFAVPTGNFGNILAGYYAKLMGLPVNKLICASNSNNVLADFINTGVYSRNRPFYKTLSPSMDILISSNLERLLYHIAGRNAAQVAGWMTALKETGTFSVSNEYLGSIQQVFWAGWADDETSMETIKRVYEDTGYVVDPHTAVAWHVHNEYRRLTGDITPCVVLSTASPFKFNQAVLHAVAGVDSVQGKNEFEMLRSLAALTGWQIPRALAELEYKQAIHTAVCGKDEMEQMVKSILAISE